MENLYQVTFSIRYYDADDLCFDSVQSQIFCSALYESQAKEKAYHFLKDKLSLGENSSFDLVCTSARLIYSSYFVR